MAERSFAVELVCYLCGHTRETSVDRLEQLRPSPCLRTHRGGLLFVSSATTVYHYGNPADLNWDEDHPKVGRPRKAAAHV